MITLVISILYFILIAVYALLSFFIVYHLVNYSINPELKVVMLALFVLVSAGLVFSNLLLFFSINWNGLFQGVSF